MGMFDDIKCDYPLADGGNALDFQSKSLDCELATYRITADGKFVCTNGGCYGSVGAGACDDFSGAIDFYTGNHKNCTDKYICTDDDSPPRWWHYTALFKKGQLIEMNGGASPYRPELQHVTREQFVPLSQEWDRRREEQFAQAVTDDHHKAMELATQAMLLPKGSKEARDLYFDAAELEFRRAKQVHVEPSQSVLYRSAASLFVDAGKDWEALGAIKEWMTFGRRIGGGPPQEIADEIADLLRGIADRISNPESPGTP